MCQTAPVAFVLFCESVSLFLRFGEHDSSFSYVFSCVFLSCFLLKLPCFLPSFQENCCFAHDISELVYRPDLTRLDGN